MQPFLQAFVAAASVYVIYVLWPLRGKRVFPPGPTPSPIIGNLLQLPTKNEWIGFSKLAEKYGPLFHVRVITQHIVVVSTVKIALDLLEKRSAYYSSRPRLVMAGEMVGFAEALALMPYSPRFHQIRRLIHKELTGAELVKYWPLHEQESYVLVKNILEEPSRLLNAIRHYAGSVILKVSFGYQTKPRDDPFLVLSEKVMATFAIASQPGIWLVDMLPWLRNIPSWIPGVKFKSLAAKWRKQHMEVIYGPYEWAKSNQTSPTLIKPNFTSTVLEQGEMKLSPDEEEVLVWSSASLFGGGADTTVSSISSFFIAMALNPQSQRQAQKELDAVLGGHRLPTLADRSSLPYLECVLLEVLRWHPIVPLGVPHLLTQDDVYEGYYIPKGTIVIANIWAMLHDPDVFPDPEAFEPDRFVNNQTAVNTVKLAFGFGRRSCPGIHFAESAMFMAFATTLIVANISDARDEQGNPLGSDIPYKSGTISHPEPFACEIKYRSQAHRDLLSAA